MQMCHAEVILLKSLETYVHVLWMLVMEWTTQRLELSLGIAAVGVAITAAAVAFVDDQSCRCQRQHEDEIH